MPSQSSVLPAAYYYFFFLVEPLLTLAGAAYAIFLPATYGRELLPRGLETFSDAVGHGIRGRLLVGCLGNCFFLLAMISLSLFPILKTELGHLPILQEKLVRALLMPLAIADITHIMLSLIPLPTSLVLRPDLWTGLIWGNVGITAVLFTVRTMWFVGIGRQSATRQKAE
ncbi:hypothetical protein NliqN6_5724 [Naganishia liquefaciens]|uniref:DUF7704 domain-containing protein n=1 Tax=Naganishia liquefaciens TaxID=104408 RepID=A0A8H3YIL9_9TREE|nr:hypothetical protein NliqN6_5724 [Naganishia liquefaciens]